jgi:hypothetical protein
LDKDWIYNCKITSWSLTLREEHRIRVFENTVLRRIFGPKRDDVTGEWITCTMSSFIICTHPEVPLGRSNKGGRVMCHARKRSEKVGRPEGRRPLGRPRLRWEDRIRMDLWDTGCEGCRVNSFGSR